MVNRLDRKKCLVMMLFDATFSRGIRRQSQMKKRNPKFGSKLDVLTIRRETHWDIKLVSNSSMIS